MGIEIEIPEETEAWKGGGGALGNGKHPLVVTQADDTQESSNGNPQLILYLESVGGAQPGGTIRDYIAIVFPSAQSKGTLGKVLQVAEAFGVELPKGKKFTLNGSDFVGKKAWGHVADSERAKDNGGFWPEIKSYDPISAEEAAKQMQGAFAGSTVQPAGAGSAGAIAGDPGPDPDIPF